MYQGMQRTLLSLARAVYARLKAGARRSGRTVANLVREVLELVFGSRDSRRRLATLRRVAGLWRHRDDLDDTDAYVRRLRRDTRRGRRPN